MNKKLSPAKAQKRKDKSAKLIEDSSLRLGAFAEEIR
jgi:hypothetical protein